MGPGLPHNSDYVLPFHITNMCAKDMTVRISRPDDFQKWVHKNAVDLNLRFQKHDIHFSAPDPATDQCFHYPREVMGEYLISQLEDAVSRAKDLGIGLEIRTNCEVLDLWPEDSLLYLRSRNKAGIQTDGPFHGALLATGHWIEKNDQQRYFSSPWPARELMRKIPAGAKVAVIGTSLSAIETLLTLTADGKFTRNRTGRLVYEPAENPRTFRLYSRMGLLPKVRGKMGGYRNKFLNRETLDGLLIENRGTLDLETIFKLLNSELGAAYGQAIDWDEIVNPAGRPADLLQKYIDDAVNGDGPDGELIWQTILHQSFDMVRDIYLNLALEERRRFDKNYTSLFFTHAATQPVFNAEKLLALLKAGIVDVVKLGEKYRLAKDNDNDFYELIYESDRGNLNRDAYRYVVNARGQAKSLETDPSELAKNLLASGTVQIEEFRAVSHSAYSGRQNAGEANAAGASYKTGSIWIDPDTHQIMQVGPDEKITKSSKVYAVGAITRGQIINASMADGIVQATSRIADDLVAHLS